MPKEVFVIGSAVLVVLLVALGALGWASRRRRQRDLPAPHTPPADFTPVGSWPMHYVATTIGGNEYDRVAVHGLGLRTRGTVAVGDEGVVLDLAGTDVFIPATDLTGVGRGTWTIDRVVEPGGLLRIGWLLGAREVVTSLRVIGDDDAAMRALEGLVGRTAQMEETR